jgi:hypothetical protein
VHTYISSMCLALFSTCRLGILTEDDDELALQIY